MAKRLILSDAEQEWLKCNHSKFTHRQLGKKFGVCVDTMRRQLMKMELQYFPGAKYQRRVEPKRWNRPCSVCGDQTPRPKYQYRCTSCHEREEGVDRCAYNKDKKVHISLGGFNLGKPTEV